MTSFELRFQMLSFQAIVRHIENTHDQPEKTHHESSHQKEKKNQQKKSINDTRLLMQQ